MAASSSLVLVNAVHSKTGGGKVYLDEVVPRLARIDPEVRYLALARPSQVEALRSRGAEARVVRPPEGSAGSFAWDQSVVPWIAWRARASLVFTPANFGSWLLGRRSLLLLRNTFAAADEWEGIAAKVHWRIMEAASRISVRLAGGAAIVSGSFRSEIARRFGVPEESLLVVHHGRSERFRPDRAEGEEPPVAGPYVAAVSDIYAHKNLERLVEAFSRLPERHAAVRLVIAGAEVDPAYAAKVRALAAGTGVADRVVFTGRLPQDKLPSLYRGALCALCLSTAETFGITQVEAMACGTPLIASDIPVMREIAGDAAEIVPPKDPDAIAGALEAILDDLRRREEMSRRGLERAARFTWDETARRLHEIVLDRLRRLGDR